jgi:hypothetical protein
VKVIYYVPVGAQSQDQLQATIMRLFPGAEPRGTKRATGASNVDWQNLDSLADLRDAKPAYSPLVRAGILLSEDARFSILARPEDHSLVTLPRRRPLLDADGAGAHPRGVAVVPRKGRHR